MDDSSSKNIKPASFSTKVDLGLAKKLVEDLKNQGFEITKPQYTVFSAKKKGLSCTLYESGKLLVQGKETPTFLEFYLEPEILGSFSYTYSALEIDTTARIGIDEAGKGDFFGPLCIAGVYASGDDILKLKDIGVKDSKTMSDKTILKLGDKIKAGFTHHIVKINPQKYNELYANFKNLNRLLAWGHATAIEALHQKTQCQNILIDQFAAENVVKTALSRKGLELNLTQRHRGEEDLVVAAASMLARQAFLQGLDALGSQFSIVLPKGAAQITITTGGKFLVAHGYDALGRVAKLHFKTLDAILAQHPEYRS
jgi:ribonuclease HIII